MPLLGWRAEPRYASSSPVHHVLDLLVESLRSMCHCNSCDGCLSTAMHCDVTTAACVTAEVYKAVVTMQLQEARLSLLTAVSTGHGFAQ